MKLSLNYGTDTIEVTIPSERLAGIIQPRESVSQQTEEELVLQALRAPISSKPLEKIVRRGEKTTIVVPDRTRHCQTRVFLPILVQKLNACGIADRDIRILLANGTHTPHSEKQKIDILGKEIYDRLKVYDHDCRNQKDLVFLGRTARGIPVYLHKLVVKAERLIVTGSILHHYFAGFGGGPKLIN
ncbi:MAG: lactate racemase domain-containing protein, partial [candidate division KSB1 bacterium]|nr:lactate racemase domain-containing protein [candidate division KSB1 bacterium]